MSGNTQTRHFRIYTRTNGNHEVAAQTKREAVARVVARLGMDEERCATVNTWAVAEVRAPSHPTEQVFGRGATEAACRPIDEPCPTIATGGAVRMITPLVLGRDACAQCRPATKPMPTLTCGGAMRVITPLILDMSRPGGHDSGHVRPADKPIQTLTTCDNVQGVFPVLEDGRAIDIRIRMLKPSELAAAHSFPKDYKLSGSRTDQVKQIGNSIPVQTAKAIVKAIFSKETK